MDRMENRLVNIERLLQDLSSTKSTDVASTTRQSSPNITRDFGCLERDSSAKIPTGDVGFRAESTAAKDMINQTVSLDRVMQKNSCLRGALDALRSVIALIHQDVDESTASFVAIQPTVQPDPTWRQVKPVLERYACMSSEPLQNKPHK
jgi:hypothetical protein